MAQPLAAGVGKAVLATYSDEDVNAIICRQGRARITPPPSCQQIAKGAS
jgi:hypothetical protein